MSFMSFVSFMPAIHVVASSVRNCAGGGKCALHWRRAELLRRPEVTTRIYIPSPGYYDQDIIASIKLNTYT